jgi:hypothetical protein
MGLFDLFKSNSENLSIDLSNFRFSSDRHIRYQNGTQVSGDNQGAWRGLEIKQDNKNYTVSMYNLSGNHPLWGNNIQMAPKQMKVVNKNSSSIELRGYGHDQFGTPFDAYGVTLELEQNEIVRITLHLHDRGVDIVYFKASN